MELHGIEFSRSDAKRVYEMLLEAKKEAHDSHARIAELERVLDMALSELEWVEENGEPSGSCDLAVAALKTVLGRK